MPRYHPVKRCETFPGKPLPFLFFVWTQCIYKKFITLVRQVDNVLTVAGLLIQAGAEVTCCSRSLASVIKSMATVHAKLAAGYSKMIHLVDHRRRRRGAASEAGMRWSARYRGARSCRHRYTITPGLYSILSGTSSQRSLSCNEAYVVFVSAQHQSTLTLHYTLYPHQSAETADMGFCEHLLRAGSPDLKINRTKKITDQQGQRLCGGEDRARVEVWRALWTSTGV